MKYIIICFWLCLILFSEMYLGIIVVIIIVKFIIVYILGGGILSIYIWMIVNLVFYICY